MTKSKDGPGVAPAAPAQPAIEGAPVEASAPAGVCVVSDGTAHMGGAVPGGLVCSAHENRYHRSGASRTSEVSAT